MKRRFIKQILLLCREFSLRPGAMLVLSMVCAIGPAHGEPSKTLWKRADSLVMVGMQQTILNRFDDAEDTFRQITDALPTHPMGHFYLGAAVQAQMLDRESYRRLPEFDALMDTTIQLAQRYRIQNPASASTYFFEGSAHLYRSFVASKRNEYWKAYRTAVKGVGLLEKAIEIDSAFYDAYLGVGSFRFWKSEKAGVLTWLPFISDEREEGISMVRTAIEKGRFVTLVARDQLAWILMSAGKQEEALEIARKNHSDYRESRFFLWTLAEVSYHLKRPEAGELFRKLLADIRLMAQNNHYSEIGILLKLAELALAREDFQQCNAMANEILVLQLDDNVRKRVDHKIERAIELKQICAREEPEVGK